MSFETVYEEAIPYDSQLLIVMGGANNVLRMHPYVVFPSERERMKVENAAAMLSPVQPERDQSSTHSREYRERRLISTAREALGVPADETDENVRTLLGRASSALKEMADGASLSTSDIIFSSTVVASMREIAAARRSIPTDVELSPLV